mmetsp:Transcript_4990/g.16129  ORF Transcript_4990/g.16129 Transcript_4990/m.16129 type:complete len:272 (+) Transcript_4990:654-1469(+)
MRRPRAFSSASATAWCSTKSWRSGGLATVPTLLLGHASPTGSSRVRTRTLTVSSKRKTGIRSCRRSVIRRSGSRRTGRNRRRTSVARPRLPRPSARLRVHSRMAWRPRETRLPRPQPRTLTQPPRPPCPPSGPVRARVPSRRRRWNVPLRRCSGRLRQLASLTSGCTARVPSRVCARSVRRCTATRMPSVRRSFACSSVLPSSARPRSRRTACPSLASTRIVPPRSWAATCSPRCSQRRLALGLRLPPTDVGPRRVAVVSCSLSRPILGLA